MPSLSGSQPARLTSQFGVMRFGAFRFGAHTAFAFIRVNGIYVAYAAVPTAGGVLVDSLTVQDALNDKANTAAFTARGFTPAAGQEVVITLGSKNSYTRLFAGNILIVEQIYDEKPVNKFYRCSCIDYTPRLNRRKVTKRYTNVSASTIVLDLLATYTSGFTATHVVAGLDVIDEITFSNEDMVTCLSRLATRAGAYWYVDYFKDVHFFLTETDQTPADLTAAHPTLNNVLRREDLSSMVTRVLSEGGGADVPADVAVGETILPIEGVAWYAALGGLVACGPQRVVYTAIRAGGGGTSVGPGAAPSTAPTLTAVFNVAGAVEAGLHLYAFTFVTGAGQSLPGPTRSITMSSVADPTVAPLALTALGTWFGLNVPGGSYKLKYSYAAGPTSSTETAASAASGVATANVNGSCRFQVTHSNDPSVTWINLYLTTNGGSTYYVEGAINNVTGGGTVDVQTGAYTDAQLVTHTHQAPAANTFALKQVDISAIAVGPTGTTQRKVYRSAAGTSTLKLVATIADNTTTVLSDAIADASLGATAPSSDTSGLAQPTGQVLAGSVSMLLGGTSAFGPDTIPYTPVVPLITAPLVAPGYALSGTGINDPSMYVIGDTVEYVYTYSRSTSAADIGPGTESAPSPTTGGAHTLVVVGAPPFANAPRITVTHTTDPACTRLRLWRSRNGGAYVFANQTNNLGTTGTSTIDDTVGGGSIVYLPLPGFQVVYGGWVVVGNGQQLVRYSQVIGNFLIGIPASGPGSITATINYGAMATASPALLGVPSSGTGAIVYGIKRGDQANVLVVVNNVVAQAALAALIGDGDDGILEEYIRDNRISITEAASRGEALLTLRNAAEVTITYTVRDKRTAAGRTIVVNLPAPTSISATLKIQDVTINQFTQRRSVFPTYNVKASSVRFSIEDLLRMVRG